MKPLALALLISVAAAASAAEDSPLVKAAKASGGPRRKSTKKVITNQDVKKSTGKLIVLPAKNPQQPSATPAAEPQKSSVEKQQADRRARDEAAARVEAAEKKVADLEKDLRRLEQAYYEENDPNYRDTTLEERFRQTKRQLDTARNELADARDALEKLKPSS